MVLLFLKTSLIVGLLAISCSMIFGGKLLAKCLYLFDNHAFRGRVTVSAFSLVRHASGISVVPAVGFIKKIFVLPLFIL